MDPIGVIAMAAIVGVRVGWGMFQRMRARR